MLEKIDLKKKIEKEAYRRLMPRLELSLGVLQRRARELGIPVIIVFEGSDGAGKGALVNSLILAMDPRGFNVHAIRDPTEEESLRPFLWRFWTKTPERGRIAVFDRSWYSQMLAERTDGLAGRGQASDTYGTINAFERQLADGGTVVIKFFLHISKKEQKKRFKRYESNPSTAWKVTKEDWRRHKLFDRWIGAVEEMIGATSAPQARWVAVGSNDLRSAKVAIFRTIEKALRRAMAAVPGRRRTSPSARAVPSPGRRSILDKIDLSHDLSPEEYWERLEKYQRRIWDLEHEVYRRRLPVAIVFEGSDAAGKGGAIRRLVQGMDPRGYEVVPFAAPNDIEKSHQYLWRFWNRIPKVGHITIFDRSWYGRVLVERVEGFCTEEEWRRAFREINETEEQWTGFGMVLVKFWMQIDKDEQLRRFKERQRVAHKRWKITDEDWRNREKWDVYRQAVDDMLLKTGTAYAPWTVVEANSKLYARIKVLKTVVKAIEKAL